MLKNKMNMLLMICCMSLIAMPLQALDFKPGKYEITSKVEMPGMPVAIPPQTIVQCLTDQDPVPDSDPKNKDCKMVSLKQTHTTVSWEMECVQQGRKVSSTGHVTYRGDTFKGTVKANLGADAGNMTMTTTIAGKRLSNCD